MGRTKQELAAEAMSKMRRLNKARLRESAGELRPYELTAQQVWLLHELPDQDGLPIGALAEAMHCHGSNVTGMVDRLEARGLVARQPSASDRRVKFVELTPAGRALRSKVTEVANHPPQALVERLGHEQLEILNDLLDKVCADLD